MADMTQYTPNYELAQPHGSEYYSIQVANENNAKIDDALYALKTSINALDSKTAADIQLAINEVINGGNDANTTIESFRELLKWLESEEGTGKLDLINKEIATKLSSKTFDEYTSNHSKAHDTLNTKVDTNTKNITTMNSTLTKLKTVADIENGVVEVNYSFNTINSPTMCNGTISTIGQWNDGSYMTFYNKTDGILMGSNGIVIENKRISPGEIIGMKLEYNMSTHSIDIEYSIDTSESRLLDTWGADIIFHANENDHVSYEIFMSNANQKLSETINAHSHLKASRDTFGHITVDNISIESNDGKLSVKSVPRSKVTGLSAIINLLNKSILPITGVIDIETEKTDNDDGSSTYTVYMNCNWGDETVSTVMSDFVHTTEPGAILGMSFTYDPNEDVVNCSYGDCYSVDSDEWDYTVDSSSLEYYFINKCDTPVTHPGVAASDNKLGHVTVDGSTIKVTADGTISVSEIAQSQVDGLADALHTYSKKPVKVGTWINGEPIYKMAFDHTFTESEIEEINMLKYMYIPFPISDKVRYNTINESAYLRYGGLEGGDIERKCIHQNANCWYLPDDIRFDKNAFNRICGYIIFKVNKDGESELLEYINANFN